jgi:hypothetical protein
MSGNTVTFEHQVDIDSMKGHPDYERVGEPVIEENTSVVEEAPKKPGRPKKTEVEVK